MNVWNNNYIFTFRAPAFFASVSGNGLNFLAAVFAAKLNCTVLTHSKSSLPPAGLKFRLAVHKLFFYYFSGFCEGVVYSFWFFPAGLGHLGLAAATAIN